MSKFQRILIEEICEQNELQYYSLSNGYKVVNIWGESAVISTVESLLDFIGE